MCHVLLVHFLSLSFSQLVSVICVVPPLTFFSSGFLFFFFSFVFLFFFRFLQSGCAISFFYYLHFGFWTPVLLTKLTLKVLFVRKVDF